MTDSGRNAHVFEKNLFGIKEMGMIGILTFINTTNYGAELQAYALFTVLKSMGYEVELINYRSPKIEKAERPKFPRLKQMVKHPRRENSIWRNKVKRAMHFDAFIQEHAKIGTSFSTQEEIGEHYSTVIVGSDQVWNLRCVKNDMTFYLGDIENESVKKISYAASFGGYTFSDDCVNSCRSALADFDAISVREQSGATTIAELLGSECEVVLDPTLLLNSKQWEPLCETPTLDDDYIFVYVVSEYDKTLAYAKKISDQLRLRIIVVEGYEKPRSRQGIEYRNDATIEEFLGLIKNATVVVTSSFHGFALSLALERSVYYALSDTVTRVNTRLISLASIVGLEDRDITNNSPVFSHIDYSKVNLQLDVARKKSLTFLENALNNG